MGEQLPALAAAKPLDIIDFAGVWTEDRLRCKGEEVGFHRVGPEVSAESIMEAVPWIRPDDVVQTIGYPDVADLVGDWGVFREGTLVATLMLRDTSRADIGWAVMGGKVCSDLG
jgi:hypothetical protein